MPKMPGRIKSLFAVALFVFCGAFATASGAATRYVSTTGDNTSNDCTNANNACATIAYAINQSNPGDTVQVAAGTYTEHGITVDRNLTIAGDSAAATVVQAAATQASATERVFHIGTGTTVTISGLTIRNGGKTGFTADAEGGGIYNDHAILTIANCTITGNRAQDGGGIFNNGVGAGAAQLTVTNSTISGNSAASGGGGIVNDGFAGSATLTITNSTLSGNSANLGGGILQNGSNGGTASVTIGNTILNAGASGPNIFNLNGTVTSNGYNLSSDNGGGFLTATRDQINTHPMLGPLAYYGGPTATHILKTGSPAIDKGDPNF